MGAERKRGKLAEFNRLLRGATDTSFVVQHGETAILPSVRYVITLDSDTQLPMEAGRRLVGHAVASAEPAALRRAPRSASRKATASCSRASASASSAPNRTMFSRVFSGHVGVDPYTTAVSDLYQDMFHEGSYVGKGIYDVDAFESALAGRVPENTLLSHDLFEGFYARAGLVTDTDLVDDYPGSYLAYSARQHRWVRGDWQIARWLWRTVPDAAGRTVANTLPVISRWKILDNLRRSLIPPALVAAPRAGMVRAAGIARALDDARPARAGVPGLHPVRALARQPHAGRAAQRAPARRAGHDHDQPAAGGLLDSHPRPSKRGDARCDRARDRADAA